MLYSECKYICFISINETHLNYFWLLFLLFLVDTYDILTGSGRMVCYQ